MIMRNGYYLSPLFSAYNHAKWYGRQSGLWDDGRVDRALGYLMSAECSNKWKEYRTTIRSCNCRDQEIRAYRGIVCKHRISMMIDVKYRQLVAEPVAS